jgi:hypothetical protein
VAHLPDWHPDVADVPAVAKSSRHDFASAKLSLPKGRDCCMVVSYRIGNSGQEVFVTYHRSRPLMATEVASACRAIASDIPHRSIVPRLACVMDIGCVVIRLLLVIGVMGAVLLPISAQADCSQWDISGHWEVGQSNGITVTFDLQQTGNAISGRYSYLVRHGGGQFAGRYEGSVTGTINGNNIQLTGEPSLGEYTGGVGSDAFIGGATRDGAGNFASWRSNRTATCQTVAEPSTTTPPSSAPPPEKPTKTLGRWKFLAIAKDDVDIYAGPGGNFENTGVVMRQGDKAQSLEQHPDGWRRLQLNCGRPNCWVAEDHLDIVSIPPIGARCPDGTHKEADGCHQN